MSENDRVRELIRHYRMKPTTFAREIGASPAAILNIVNDKRNAGKGILNKIVETFPDVSISWLLVGQGPMLKQGDTKNISNVTKTSTTDKAQLAEEFRMIGEEFNKAWLLMDIRESIANLRKLLDRLSELLDKNAGKL